MGSRITEVRRGERFTWQPAGTRDKVFIDITRAARDGSWADIRCCTWAIAWTKRQPLPLPEGTVAEEWDYGDVTASEPDDFHILLRNDQEGETSG